MFTLAKQLANYVDTYNKGYAASLPNILSILKTGKNTIQVELLYDVFRYIKATPELARILYEWLSERNLYVTIPDVSFKPHWLELLVYLVKRNGICDLSSKDTFHSNCAYLNILPGIHSYIKLEHLPDTDTEELLNDAIGAKTVIILKTFFSKAYDEFKYRFLLEDRNAWDAFCDKMEVKVSDYKLPILQ